MLYRTDCCTTMNVAAVSEMPTVTVSMHDVSGTEAITTKQRMMSSCTGAILTSFFMTPLDVVKIRLQAQQKPLHTGSCFVYNNGLMDYLCVCSQCSENGNRSLQRSRTRPRFQPWYKRSAHFSGTLDAFVKIARNEGVTALWSGLPPTLIQSVPATVIYFTIYDNTKYALGYSETDSNTKYIPVFAGTSARVVAATFICPLELIRTKMQSVQLSYREVGAAIKSSVRNDGILSMMRGLGPSLLRDIPFSGIYWFIYEMSKSRWLQHSGNDTLHFLEAFSSGALAGSTAAVITLPFDVIKTHRQIELGENFVHGKQVTSTWKLIMQLYHQKGISALFAGIVPRVVKVAPACAIMISSYEFGKAVFRRRNASTTDTATSDQ